MRSHSVSGSKTPSLLEANEVAATAPATLGEAMAGSCTKLIKSSERNQTNVMAERDWRSSSYSVGASKMVQSSAADAAATEADIIGVNIERK
jgi:hypothetical protein